MAWEYGQQIWDALKLHITNEYGVAGLMGNLLSESGLIPFRLQGDFSTDYIVSKNYTDNVNSGAISEYDFVHSGNGYGLAQWTFYTRKQNLYNMKTTLGLSIGSVTLGTSYLIYELDNMYTGVLDVLINATSIRQASDKVLHDFESPADQSEAVEIYRASLGQQIYDVYSGNPPHPPVKTNKMPLWMMLRR